MEIIVIVALILMAVSGWVFSAYVNDDWFKDLIKTSGDWYTHCMEINNTWYERNVELAKKVDELTAENNRMRNQLKKIELVDEERE